MAYTQQSWNTGDPITQEKMRKIEKGIYDAHVTADSSSNSITNLNAALSELSTTVSNQASSIQQAQLDIAAAQRSTEDGTKAWTQIVPLVEFEEDGVTIKKNFATRLLADEGHINDNADLIATVQGWITDAQSVGGQVYDAANARFKNAESLAERIGEINRLITNVTNTANSTQQTISPTNGRSFADRLTSMDANQIPARTLISIIEEIDNAHTSAQNDTTYSNINARLEEDELTLNTHTSQIGALDESRVKYTDVKNNLESQDIDKPLSAAKGKELKDTIGGSYGPSNTVAAGIATAQATAETNAQNYTDAHKVDKDDIYNGVDYITDDEKVLDARVGKTLQDAIDAINTGLNTAETGLVARVSAAEEAISHTASGADNGGLTERLTQAESDIDTIASELSMYNTQTGAIEATNSRVATIEENVVAIGKEIGMLQDDAAVTDLSTAVSRANTRVDGIEDEINAAHRTLANGTDTLDNRFDDIENIISHAVDVQTDDAGGLTERLTAVESEINTATTGIKARISANESDIDTIKSDLNTAETGLKARVIALESEPKSATVTISADRITYSIETGLPTIYTDNTKTIALVPTQDSDYLLQGADEKYYYWKYIGVAPNGTWNLISSGGGSGSGNTSGYDLTAAEYEEIEEYAENTDYYVLEADGIRHHYRYITTTVNNEPTLTEIEIGIIVDTDQIKKYNISRVTGKKREYNSQTQTWTETDEDVEYLNLYQYDYGQDNTIIDTQTEPFAQIELPKGGDGGSSSSQKNTLTRIGTEVIQKVTGSKILLRVFFSSYDATGTESSVGYATLRAGNSVIFSNKELSSYESSIVPNPLTWQDNTAGFHEFDVTDYCGAGNTIFTLSVDVGGSAPLGKTWRVNLTELRLESDAPDNLLITVDDEYAFPYTPIGAVNKTLTVTIDKGTENEQVRNVSISNTISGTSTSYVLDPDDLELGHGKHTIELQLFAQIGGVTESSNKINREYIWYDINDIDTPIIIASQYEGTTIETTQYSTIEIPYQVYKKNTNIINVEYYLDEEETPYQTSTLVNSNTGILAYIASGIGNHTLKIKVDDVYIAINLAIARSDKDLSPISGMVIDFDPTTLSNSAANRLPTWNTKINGTNYTFGLTASSNFNWSEDINGGGYKKDENGDRCFVIKAGSYVDLNYPMFANDVFGNGAEMKIIFKTSAVRNAEAVWYENVGKISGKTVGIQLGTHSGWLKTDKAVATSTSADEDSDEETITIKGITYYYWQPDTVYNPNDVRIIQKIIYRCTKATTAVDYDLEEADLDEEPYKSYMKNWAKVGQLDTEVIATNSYLYFPYSEEDKIELDININKSNTGNDFIMSYEDGVPSKAYAYTTGAGGDKITHNNTIHIGSDECDVYIYHLRYYVKSLTTDQILQNFIADGKDLNEKVERYDRNCIYWNPYLNDGNGGYTLTKTSQSSLDPIKLAEKMPDVKVLMLDTDVFTTSKKDFIMNSSLRCIHAEGGNIYKSRGDEDNWFFTNGFHAGQGTTSDNYGQSARNVDFLFEVDAKHWPSKEKNMGKYKISENPNYISTVFKGTDASEFTNNSWSASYNEWAANTSYIIGDKVSITDTEDNNKGTIYACTKAHTSDETFDEKNWKKIGTFSKCSDWMADDCKITLTGSSVPNNYFNFKANVASSENVNNALFQKRYDDFLTYKSPAQKAQTEKHHDTYENIDDVKVKNCMEFVPAVLFVREHAVNAQTGQPEGHVEFNDCNWHFYALGNIGDSKKSDYTRAYDPDDMNEFTCENSDNNTNNGQFQSGVFTYQGHAGAIETDYTAWNETTAYAQDAIVVYDGMVYIRTGATQEALEEGETYSWVASDWTAITYTGWTDNDPPYFAPRTNPNPMDYTYPISSSQWNVKFDNNYLNRKHMTLVKEKFDGDHSFEFRYACCGDYRDGDRINDTHGDSDILVDPLDSTKGYKTKDDVQEVLNHDVVLALYEWVITASPEQYVSEAPQWFVKNAMEFFYAYTHYYTMMDNRAKNTFWHFAKTGNYIKVSRPVKELLHIYEIPDGNGGYKPTTDTELDPTNPYYTQYAFDLWVYDCDTALGIDNNGALVFPYGKEDEDYRGEDAASGYAFNGAGSIFWRRLKTTFVDEIADVMTRAKDCFDPENLINEFDSFQNCFPEEIWRLDIERKYIRTYTGESIDNSITTNKQNARFLMSMMQGRKKYQRRQWVRDQSFYFNSKYKIGEIEVNKTEFNIVSPAGDHSLLAVPPDYHLHLTPYQDMYLNVVVGNGSPIPPIRAKANQEYTIKLDDYTAGNFAETRVYISGFRMISKLGGLAPMYPYAFTLNGLDHLKELDVGTDVSGYLNGNFTELPLIDKVQLPLLEKLNIKNCSSLSTSIGLKTANNLRVVEAAGSSIGGISLPDYTQIEVLHLPVTVTDLILNNARFLKDFSITDITGAENYNNLYTLNIDNSDYSGTYVWEENTDYIEDEIRVIGNNVYKCKKDHTSVTASTQLDNTAWTNYLNTNWTLIKANTKLPVDWMDIATEMLNKQSLETKISFLKLNVATIGNIQEMEPFAEFKETLENAGGIMNFTGTIHVTGDYSDVEKETYEDTWPGLTMDVSEGTLQQKYKVTYKYDDYIDNNGNTVHGEEIKTLYISRGDPVIDIWQYRDNDTQQIVHMLDEMPHRDSTVRKTYQFGLRSYSSYLENSGWRQEGKAQPMSVEGVPTVTSNMTIYTYFKEENALYDIKWYLRKNLDGTPRASTLVKTSSNPVPYGGGEEEEAPTVMDIHNAGLETATVEINGGQVTYSIFKGWEKLPVNIMPTITGEPYCIYAQWEEGSMALVDLFADTSNLTPAQLLALSALDNTGRVNYTNNAAAINSRVTYTLGHDSIVSGTELIGPNATYPILRLDLPATSTNPAVLNTAIQPMSSANDAFTIAIDYCLNADAEYNSQYKAGIIASCYSVNSSANTISGFALYNNLNTNLNTVGPYVGFGDMFNSSAQSVPVGSSININSRNMVVLRHPAGSSVLYVYSTITSEGAISPTIIAQQIPWNNSTNDAYLVFGQVTNSTSNDYTSIKSVTTRAKGTIYWAKYWPSDLGIGECKRIASWPHEDMTFAFSTIESYATSGERAIGSAPSPALGLTTVSSSAHGKIIHAGIRGVAGQIYGWGTSPMRNVCNGTLLLGLPIQLQSILCKMNTAYYTMAPYVDNSMTYQPLASIPSYIRDYIALPSARSLGNKSSTTDYDAEENNDNLEPYKWLEDNTSVLVYNYDPNTTGSWVPASEANRAHYLNLRFPEYSLNWSTENPLRIFRIISATIPSSSTIYTEINKIGGIKTGDIYINDAGVAFVYITDNDITVNGLQNESNSGIFTTNNGGWLKASEYWTRSIGYGQSVNNFVYVDTASTVELSETKRANNTGLSLNYTIAI